MLPKREHSKPAGSSSRKTQARPNLARSATLTRLSQTVVTKESKDINGSLTTRRYFHKLGNMKTVQARAAFAALSQEHRLRIFRLLVEKGPEGLSAGAIADQLGMPAPTTSFHLKELMGAGLILVRQDGRFMWYRANFAAMNGLIAYLTENCCQGSVCDIACAPVAKRKRKTA